MPRMMSAFQQSVSNVWYYVTNSVDTRFRQSDQFQNGRIYTRTISFPQLDPVLTREQFRMPTVEGTGVHVQQHKFDSLWQGNVNYRAFRLNLQKMCKFQARL